MTSSLPDFAPLNPGYAGQLAEGCTASARCMMNETIPTDITTMDTARNAKKIPA
jgi:hypothetical protein